MPIIVLLNLVTPKCDDSETADRVVEIIGDLVEVRRIEVRIVLTLEDHLSRGMLDPNQFPKSLWPVVGGNPVS